MIHETKIEGIRLHVVPTNNFKTNTVVLHIKAPLTKESVTKRAILPYLLQSGTEALPTRQDIRTYLDDLYGATLSVDVGKKGEQQILSFKMDIANEKYLSDQKPLLEEAIKLLSQIVLNPKLESGVFSKTIVENEKRNLKQRIQSIFDDKIRYANMRVTEEMCKEEPYGLSVWGYQDDIDRLTAEDLYEQYSTSLSQDDFDLFIVGDVNENEINELVQRYFQKLQKKEIEKNRTIQSKNITKTITQENVVFEEQDIKQGKLHIGFRTNTTYGDDDYFAMQMFNGLFGGFSHSKLFMNVREKASLAYYAASRFESHKGIMMVMSGIEFGNYDQTVSIIKEQLQSMQNGDFSEEEIEQTKAVIKNQILETIDVPKGYIELLYHNVISNQKVTIDEWIANIDLVTKEEIINAAKKVQLDTIYFLKGKEELK